jgi:hypothetical protein
LHRLVPGPSDGLALPDGRRGGRYHVASDESHEGVAGYAEPSLDEDAEVQEQDRDLCEVDGELVEDLGDVEELEIG